MQKNTSQVAHPAFAGRPWRAVTAVLLTSLLAAALHVPSEPASAADEPNSPAPGTPDERPNIVLITTDDQTVADMAYMPRTRRLLGEEGVTFTDAISPYPLCCPARATIMTGQLSHNHRVLTNKEPEGGYQAFREHGNPERSLGVWLQDAGYSTMFVGKYLNGYGSGGYRRDVPPGWDQWYGGLSGGGLYDYFDVTLNENGTVVDHPGKYQTDLYGALTRKHITEWSKSPEPFFIWESNLAPHSACHPHPERRGCSWGPPMPAPEDEDAFANLRLNRPRHGAFNERVVSDKPTHIRRSDRWGKRELAEATEQHRARARSLRAVDRSVEETVALLDEVGELENTLIIFTSDNGYLLGQHRSQGKTLPYEPSLQVPLLMRGDGLPAGVSRSQTVALVDLAPTIADAAEAEDEAAELTTFDGRSVLPVIHGEDGADGYGALSIEAGPQTRSSPQWFYRGVRTDRYTYVEYPRRHELELYDRRADPNQLDNVAYRPAYRATRAAMARKLEALQDCDGAECLRVDGRVPRPERQSHLASGATVHPDELGSVGRARQVVTVTARNWRTGRGQLTAWERTGRTWRIRRAPFPVTLGRRGLVWAERRRQGTSETPAGTFEPESAVGRRRDPGTALRFRRFDRNDYWVHDPRSRRTYNTYQDRHSKNATWRKSRAERWWGHRDRYPYALVLDYNLPRGQQHSNRLDEWRARRPADVRRGSFWLHAGGRLEDHGWVSTSQRQLRWLLRWTQPRKGTAFVVGTPRYLRSRL